MQHDILLRSPLFNGLDVREIESLLLETPVRTRKYKVGSMIAQNGDVVNDLLILADGVVKGEMVDYAGRVIKIEDISAPGALGAAFIFGSRNTFPVNVIAVTDAEIIIIERQIFLKLLMRNDKILVNFLNMISNRSQFLSEKIKFLNFKTIRGKLAQYILNLRESGMNIVRLDRTQNDLADFFGVTRPSISRALGEMESEGLIAADGKLITILDLKKLAALTTY